MIEDLLVISEFESGRVNLNLQGIALKPLIEKVFEDFKARGATKAVKFANQVPPINVRADPDRLEQVLGNLVDNAIKYSARLRSITIAC